jgi:PAT family beta-lactamase induction signal transducer AmpG
MDRTRPPRGSVALFLLLGFSAGLPFAMFNAVLLLRLARHGVDLAVIGFFAWVALLPTFKFAWAPLLERFAVPGFAGFWGQRRGWLMLAQLGICASLAGTAWTADDASLPLTALFAILLAFWATTLEVAADGWRIVLAPDQATQGPIVAAYLWGYRGAMVASGSGAALLAARAGWSAAYGCIALVAFLPWPILAALPPEPGMGRGRTVAMAKGLAASAALLAASAIAAGLIGGLALAVAQAMGIGAGSNIVPWVLAICLLPFLALGVALPGIRRLSPHASLLGNAYVALFHRHGTAILPLIAFVSIYRMGDVLALTLSHPLWNARGYGLVEIGMADGAVALAGTILGVAAGGWLAARRPIGWALAAGALASAVGNWVFVWLWRVPPAPFVLYAAAGVDQFGHGVAAAVFVVYLSLLTDRRHPAAQFALLSGLAFLLPRLLAGASGSIAKAIGYDGFFLLSGALSFGAVLLLPIIPLRPPAPAPGRSAD